MIRKRRDLLDQSAHQRFPDDEGKRRWYTGQVLEASDHHDATYYWITPEAWQELRQRIVAEHGPRPRLDGTPNSQPAPSICDTAPAHGPGTELKLILNREADAKCGCAERICRMNWLGIDGCVEQREKIVDELMDAASSLGKWYERAAVKLAPDKSREHVGSIVDRAINAARENQQ